jgi:heme/copper-type cytochrome/quinol oxidase subunit 2
MVILRRVVLHFEGEVVAKANNPSVAQSVLGDLLHGFFLLTAWILGIAGVVFVVALLAGPYRWAVWLRAQVGRGLHAVAQLANRERRGHALAWMGAHSEPLQLAGAAVAFILFLVISISWISFVVIGVLLVIYELFLARLKPHDQGASPDRPANRGVGEPAPH